MKPLTSSRKYDLALAQLGPKINYFAFLHAKDLPGYEQDDVRQEMHMALWKAVENYDPNNRARFNTYFWQIARNRMTDLYKRAHTEKRQSEWFDFYDTEPIVDSDRHDHRVVHVDQLPQNPFNTLSLSPEDWYLLREQVLDRLDNLAAA